MGKDHNSKTEGSNTLVTFFNTTLSPPFAWAALEPCIAQNGGLVFYVANWFVAGSTDGGQHWSYIDPVKDMPDFIGDQDVIFDQTRNLLLWNRLGGNDSSGKNRFILSASTDGGLNWCKYNITPSTLKGSWNTDQNFDYPRIALSNNNLYIMTFLNDTGVPNGQMNVLIRYSLDELKGCSILNGLWWSDPAKGGTQLSTYSGFVQGATTTMYIGDHNGGSSFNLFSLPENSNILGVNTISIPGWPLELGGNCPSKDGQNWCTRSYSGILAGWVTNGVIGFMWNANSAPQSGFPFPYVEAATFRESDKAYIGRPYLWWNAGAYHYPYASVNPQGNLGLTVYYSEPSSFPSPCFAISDDLSPNVPPPWEVYILINGKAGADKWGDYVRNRSFRPPQVGWVTAGHFMTNIVDPVYFVLCRTRDVQTVRQWWTS